MKHCEGCQPGLAQCLAARVSEVSPRFLRKSSFASVRHAPVILHGIGSGVGAGVGGAMWLGVASPEGVPTAFRRRCRLSGAFTRCASGGHLLITY